MYHQNNPLYYAVNVGAPYHSLNSSSHDKGNAVQQHHGGQQSEATRPSPATPTSAVTMSGDLRGGPSSSSHSSASTAHQFIEANKNLLRQREGGIAAAVGSSSSNAYGTTASSAIAASMLQKYGYQFGGGGGVRGSSAAALQRQEGGIRPTSASIGNIISATAAVAAANAQSDRLLTRTASSSSSLSAVGKSIHHHAPSAPNPSSTASGINYSDLLYRGIADPSTVRSHNVGDPWGRVGKGAAATTTNHNDIDKDHRDDFGAAAHPISNHHGRHSQQQQHAAAADGGVARTGSHLARAGEALLSPSAVGALLVATDGGIGQRHDEGKDLNKERRGDHELPLAIAPPPHQREHPKPVEIITTRTLPTSAASMETFMARKRGDLIVDNCLAPMGKDFHPRGRMSGGGYAEASDAERGGGMPSIGDLLARYGGQSDHLNGAKRSISARPAATSGGVGGGCTLNRPAQHQHEEQPETPVVVHAARPVPPHTPLHNAMMMAGPSSTATFVHSSRPTAAEDTHPIHINSSKARELSSFYYNLPPTGAAAGDTPSSPPRPTLGQLLAMNGSSSTIPPAPAAATTNTTARLRGGGGGASSTSPSLLGAMNPYPTPQRLHGGAEFTHMTHHDNGDYRDGAEKNSHTNSRYHPTAHTTPQEPRREGTYSSSSAAGVPPPASENSLLSLYYANRGDWADTTVVGPTQEQQQEEGRTCDDDTCREGHQIKPAQPLARIAPTTQPSTSAYNTYRRESIASAAAADANSMDSPRRRALVDPKTNQQHIEATATATTQSNPRMAMDGGERTTMGNRTPITPVMGIITPPPPPSLEMDNLPHHHVFTFQTTAPESQLPHMPDDSPSPSALPSPIRSEEREEGAVVLAGEEGDDGFGEEVAEVSPASAGSDYPYYSAPSAEEEEQYAEQRLAVEEDERLVRRSFEEWLLGTLLDAHTTVRAEMDRCRDMMQRSGMASRTSSYGRGSSRSSSAVSVTSAADSTSTHRRPEEALAKEEANGRRRLDTRRQQEVFLMATQEELERRGVWDRERAKAAAWRQQHLIGLIRDDMHHLEHEDEAGDRSAIAQTESAERGELDDWFQSQYQMMQQFAHIAGTLGEMESQSRLAIEEDEALNMLELYEAFATVQMALLQNEKRRRSSLIEAQTEALRQVTLARATVEQSEQKQRAVIDDEWESGFVDLFDAEQESYDAALVLEGLRDAAEGLMTSEEARRLDTIEEEEDALTDIWLCAKKDFNNLLQTSHIRRTFSDLEHGEEREARHRLIAQEHSAREAIGQQMDHVIEAQLEKDLAERQSLLEALETQFINSVSELTVGEAAERSTTALDEDEAIRSLTEYFMATARSTAEEQELALRKLITREEEHSLAALLETATRNVHTILNTAALQKGVGAMAAKESNGRQSIVFEEEDERMLNLQTMGAQLAHAGNRLKRIQGEIEEGVFGLEALQRKRIAEEAFTVYSAMEAGLAGGVETLQQAVNTRRRAATLAEVESLQRTLLEASEGDERGATLDPFCARLAAFGRRLAGLEKAMAECQSEEERERAAHVAHAEAVAFAAILSSFGESLRGIEALRFLQTVVASEASHRELVKADEESDRSLRLTFTDQQLKALHQRYWAQQRALRDCEEDEANGRQDITADESRKFAALLQSQRDALLRMQQDKMDAAQRTRLESHEANERHAIATDEEDGAHHLVLRSVELGHALRRVDSINKALAELLFEESAAREHLSNISEPSALNAIASMFEASWFAIRSAQALASLQAKESINRQLIEADEANGAATTLSAAQYDIKACLAKEASARRSLDSCQGAETGERQDITADESRMFAALLQSQRDALLRMQQDKMDAAQRTRLESHEANERHAIATDEEDGAHHLVLRSVELSHTLRRVDSINKAILALIGDEEAQRYSTERNQAAARDVILSAEGASLHRVQWWVTFRRLEGKELKVRALLGEDEANSRNDLLAALRGTVGRIHRTNTVRRQRGDLEEAEGRQREALAQRQDNAARALRRQCEAEESDILHRARVFAERCEGLVEKEASERRTILLEASADHERLVAYSNRLATCVEEEAMFGAMAEDLCHSEATDRRRIEGQFMSALLTRFGPQWDAMQSSDRTDKSHRAARVGLANAENADRCAIELQDGATRRQLSALLADHMRVLERRARQLQTDLAQTQHDEVSGRTKLATEEAHAQSHLKTAEADARRIAYRMEQARLDAEARQRQLAQSKAAQRLDEPSDGRQPLIRRATGMSAMSASGGSPSASTSQIVMMANSNASRTSSHVANSIGGGGGRDAYHRVRSSGSGAAVGLEAGSPRYSNVHPVSSSNSTNFFSVESPLEELRGIGVSSTSPGNYSPRSLALMRNGMGDGNEAAVPTQISSEKANAPSSADQQQQHTHTVVEDEEAFEVVRATEGLTTPLNATPRGIDDPFPPPLLHHEAEEDASDCSHEYVIPSHSNSLRTSPRRGNGRIPSGLAGGSATSSPSSLSIRGRTSHLDTSHMSSGEGGGGGGASAYHPTDSLISAPAVTATVSREEATNNALSSPYASPNQQAVLSAFGNTSSPSRRDVSQQSATYPLNESNIFPTTSSVGEGSSILYPYVPYRYFNTNHNSRASSPPGHAAPADVAATMVGEGAGGVSPLDKCGGDAAADVGPRQALMAVLGSVVALEHAGRDGLAGDEATSRKAVEWRVGLLRNAHALASQNASLNASRVASMSTIVAGGAGGDGGEVVESNFDQTQSRREEGEDDTFCVDDAAAVVRPTDSVDPLTIFSAVASSSPATPSPEGAAAAADASNNAAVGAYSHGGGHHPNRSTLHARFYDAASPLYGNYVPSEVLQTEGNSLNHTLSGLDGGLSPREVAGTPPRGDVTGGGVGRGTPSPRHRHHPSDQQTNNNNADTLLSLTDSGAPPASIRGIAAGQHPHGGGEEELSTSPTGSTIVPISSSKAGLRSPLRISRNPSAAVLESLRSPSSVAAVPASPTSVAARSPATVGRGSDVGESPIRNMQQQQQQQQPRGGEYSFLQPVNSSPSVEIASTPTRPTMGASPSAANSAYHNNTSSHRKGGTPTLRSYGPYPPPKITAALPVADAEGTDHVHSVHYDPRNPPATLLPGLHRVVPADMSSRARADNEEERRRFFQSNPSNYQSSNGGGEEGGNLYSIGHGPRAIGGGSPHSVAPSVAPLQNYRSGSEMSSHQLFYGGAAYGSNGSQFRSASLIHPNYPSSSSYAGININRSQSTASAAGLPPPPWAFGMKLVDAPIPPVGGRGGGENKNTSHHHHQQQCLKVVKVIPPAHPHIDVGDCIIAVDGKPITTQRSMRIATAESPDGLVEFTVMRADNGAVERVLVQGNPL